MRIGHGYDVHRFTNGDFITIGGVKIEHCCALLAHAIADALLGAAAQGDIGYHFPDTDSKYKNISSMILLTRVNEILATNGYEIVNIDSTVIAQAPKMAPHIQKMRENIANALNISSNDVNVKATTEENLGFTGRKEGIAAHAVCIIKSKA